MVEESEHFLFYVIEVFSLVVELLLGSLKIDLCSDTAEQFLHDDRLVDKVVGTKLKALRDVLLRVKCGEDNDGQVLGVVGCTETADDFKPVDARHHQVEQYEVRLLLCDCIEGGLTSIGGSNLKSVLREHLLDKKDVQWNIIDNEDGQTVHVDSWCDVVVHIGMFFIFIVVFLVFYISSISSAAAGAVVASALLLAVSSGVGEIYSISLMKSSMVDWLPCSFM